MDIKSSGRVQLEVQKAIYVKKSLAGNVGSAGCFAFRLQLAHHSVSLDHLVYGSKNVIACTECTVVGDLIGNFS